MRQIADQWFEGERLVTSRTLCRRIGAFAGFSYSKQLVLPFTANHCRQRLKWCKERQHSETKWQNVFSDE